MIDTASFGVPDMGGLGWADRPFAAVAFGHYDHLVVASSGMTLAIKRTLSMRPEVDQMLAAHVQRTPGATMSSTVNAALVDYLEAAALAAYREWDAQADPEECAALEAFVAHDDVSWAAE